MARILDAGRALAEAARLIRAGRPVAVPTETVYGLAADATNGEAVARIYEAKGRPRFNPLIAHVAGLDMALEIGVFDPVSLALARRFWPGPLTLVTPLARPGAVHPLATAALATVALRCPKGFAAELIAEVGRPLAAPSANSSGRISATTAAAVAADLGDRIALIVDGGATAVGVESTILKAGPDGVRLLRPGGVAAEEIEAVLAAPLLRGPGAGVEAPGMLASHYAPRAHVRLAADAVAPGEALLGFGGAQIAGAENAVAMRDLSPSGDLREAAANLFSFMQALDRSGAAAIAVAPIPERGLGEAINDRLRRAAAPRDTPPGAA